MFASLNSIVGLSQVGFGGLTVDATPRMRTGSIVPMQDNWWGAGEFMYVKAGGAIRGFGLVQLNPAFNSTLKTWDYVATEAASTAILGRTVGVAMKAMAADDYGWICVGGVVPVNSNAAVAADATFSVAATGQGGAAAAGKQILNSRIVGASTITVAKTNCTQVGLGKTLYVPDSGGWFVGAYLSGTGIAATTKVSSIDPSGRIVTLSADTTAVVAGTVTATYNNATIYYNVAHINRPFQQGAIT